MVLVTWFNPAYVLKKYHVFLFYQCSNLFSFLVNAYGQPALSTIYRVSCKPPPPQLIHVVWIKPNVMF
jgi:choline transport protein